MPKLAQRYLIGTRRLAQNPTFLAAAYVANVGPASATVELLDNAAVDETVFRVRLRVFAQSTLSFIPKVPIRLDRGLWARYFSGTVRGLVLFGASADAEKKEVYGMEPMELAAKTTTLYVNAERIISLRPGWLMDFWVADTSGAAVLITLYDGVNSTAPVLCAVRVPANGFSHLEPTIPVRCENGLYVSGLTSTVVGGVQFMAEE